MIKVLIVDDQQLLLDLMSRMLENHEDIHVVACSTDGHQALALTERFQPDVVLMDIHMPVCDGIEATKLIKNYKKSIKILILSSSSEDKDVHEALSSGADGYVVKTIGEQELVAVIRSVYADMEVIHRDVRDAAQRSRSGQFEDSDGVRKLEIDGVHVELSERDLEIIRMIVDGKSTKEMAEALFVSEGRLRNIITEIIQKLMCENRTQVAVFALKNHLV
jgi:DNA-binding NarL/FixJ family response regulator